MGGAVAIDLTSRNVSKISALIVENTFTSIPDLISGRVPWDLKFIRYFCTQHWNSRRKIATLPSLLPILMFSGLLDTVVPASDMQRLWDVAQTRHVAKTRHVEGGRWHSNQCLMRKIRHAEDGKHSGTEIQGQEERDKFFKFEHGGHRSLLFISSIPSRRLIIHLTVDTRLTVGYSNALHAFLDKIIPDDSNVNSALHSDSEE
jgi:fermentation-respiration switch protein FrsA (DUF1100 family)